MIKISTKLIQLVPFTETAGRPATKKKAIIAHYGFFSNVLQKCVQWLQVFVHKQGIPQGQLHLVARAVQQEEEMMKAFLYLLLLGVGEVKGQAFQHLSLSSSSGAQGKQGKGLGKRKCSCQVIGWLLACKTGRQSLCCWGLSFGRIQDDLPCGDSVPGGELP